MSRKKQNRNYRIIRYVVYKETLLDARDHLFTFLGTFAGIGLIGYLGAHQFDFSDQVFLIGSFGATAVLIYGHINSPLAQPRNLFGGHILSALIGVTFHKLFPDNIWLASALSVSVSIVVMQMTKTLHPPGGATALIANIGSTKMQSLGYWYVVFPVLTGVTILFLVALVFNNLSKTRSYPANFKKIFTPRRFRK
jgi:CBS domain-containing membrane protein